MKAVGYRKAGAIDGDGALVDFETGRPVPGPRDLLVAVGAVSVNPVDTKIRRTRAPEGDGPAILGWDAAGEVVETGAEVSGFAPGDRVYYAGAVDRPGTNAEYHVVDARIVGHAPGNLSDAEAAALPLTSLTAYEMLFDRLRVEDPVPGAAPAVLVIGGAGGVGSVAIQLLRARTDLTVIATASRPATRDWCRALGAHHVLDHSKPLPPQLSAIGAPGFVFSTTHTGQYVEQIAEMIAPQGRFGLIDDPQDLSIMPFKPKAVSVHWEFMFTRPLFDTPDIGRQGEILAEVAALVDAGQMRSTATETMGRIDAATLTRAHGILESHTARGKLVLEGF